MMSRTDRVDSPVRIGARLRRTILLGGIGIAVLAGGTGMAVAAGGSAAAPPAKIVPTLGGRTFDVGILVN